MKRYSQTALNKTAYAWEGARKARQGMSRRTHSEMEKEIDTLLVYVRVLARVVRVKLLMRTYQAGLFSFVLTTFTEQSYQLSSQNTEQLLTRPPFRAVRAHDAITPDPISL